MDDDTLTPEDKAELSEAAAKRLEFSTVTIGLILFMIGIAVGFPLAVIGTSFLTENAGILVSIILTLAGVIALLGTLILLFRRRILQFLFNVSATQLELFSRPLSETARSIMDKNPASAINSAEELTRLLLARWTWISTRRWLIGSLTGLIASLAALAGTALLFRQNELIAIQTTRLEQQNDLLVTQIELGEAQRTAGIVQGLLEIGDKLSQETEALKNDGRPGAFFKLDELTNGIRARIIAATQSARPYRYLQTSLVNANDTNALNMLAMSRRPEILRNPELVAELAGRRNRGILREYPVSPERGVILSMLYSAGILETELLSFFGADFSYSEVAIDTLNLMTFRFARLRFSSFEHMALNSVTFGGASLDKARFRNSVLTKCDFSSIPSDKVEPPYRGDPGMAYMPTTMAGVDFTDAVVLDADFTNVHALAMNFDGALVSNTTFNGADIGGSTFRNAILVSPDFTGAGLQSVDFDGAIVFGADFLEKAMSQAQEGTFKPERFEMAEITFGEVETHPRAVQIFSVPEELISGQKPFRIKRVKPFGE
ncbi:pentapeptide repeat-containing protein [uncultured Roseibium sp.]|uniref:pentapeptide repeat-containing protein n=1 Tax=uncultured Roseibium sp. TaxID=1936171 RepID=UPI0032164DC4